MQRQQRWSGGKGTFHPSWRPNGTAVVIFEPDRRPPALTEDFFRRQIPLWQARGIAFNIAPTDYDRAPR